MDEFKSRNVLSYNEETNYFMWHEDIYSLRKLIGIILDEVEEETDVAINEDLHHKMCSFKMKDCTIKYYQTTKKIIIQGSGSSNLITKLSEFIEDSEESSQTQSAVGLTDTCLRGAEASPDFHLNSTEMDSTCIASQDFTQSTCECSLLKSELRKVQSDIVQLRKDVDSNLDSSCYMQIDEHETTIKLREENKSLRTEVFFLKARNDELTNAIQNLESEKASLVTCLRILDTDLKAKGHDQDKESEKLKSKKKNDDINEQDDDKRDTNKQPWTEVKHGRRKKNKTGKTANPVIENAAESKVAEQGENKRSTTVIIGDSIISRLQGWRMSDKNNKVVVRSFGGAKVNDLFHYLVPTLEDKPDRIILHIGTNDLKNEEPREVSEKVVKVCEFIEKKSPNTEIVISELTPRSDSENANKSSCEVNKILRSFNRTRDWKFISHSDMNTGCLNSRGVHLNSRGTSVLARNIKLYISQKDD